MSVQTDVDKRWVTADEDISVLFENPELSTLSLEKVSVEPCLLRLLTGILPFIQLHFP